MAIDWDEFDGEVAGDFPNPFKFRDKGDQVVGTVYHVRTTDFGGRSDKVPELWVRLDDGTTVGVAASQVNLRRLMCQHRPAAGDRVAIVYKGDGVSASAGQSPPKLFDFAIKRAAELAGSIPAPSPTPAPAAVAAAPVAAGVSADSLI